MRPRTPTLAPVRLSPWIALAGLAIAYSPSWLNRVVGWTGVDWDWLRGPPSVLVWNWLAVGALFAFILGVERRDARSIRLVKPNWTDIQWAVFFWGIGSGVSGAVQAWLPSPSSDGLNTVLALPIPTLVLLILTTATTEEILFRGYAIERLRELTGHAGIAACVSFALFVLPHVVFFGPYWLAYQGVNVVLLYVLYLWRRNLWTCMLMHFLGNAMILVPALGLA
jgi:membrane protease YdiL (CAAX protease family)